MATSEKHLKELLNGFDTVMMVTRSNGADVHARPMRIAEIGETGALYFATSAQSPKVQEIENDASVSLMFQSSSKFVALHGKARVERNAQLINRLWSEAWRVWFPKGKDDPSLVVLKVEPKDAEYWDNTGIKGLSYAFSATKAYLKGEKPEASAELHGKITM